MTSSFLGFAPNDAISAGMIGAADGPTAILVSRSLNSSYTGQICSAIIGGVFISME